MVWEAAKFEQAVISMCRSVLVGKGIVPSPLAIPFITQRGSCD